MDSRLDVRNPALQHCSKMKVLPVSKRGTITLPPTMRKKMGLDRMENPLMIVKEEGGRLIMEPAAAMPVRDLPESVIRGWIEEDEADGETLRKLRQSGK